MGKPVPPAEADLIRLAREAARIKMPAAARAAGISTARWSQIETGYEKRGGEYRPVRGPAATVAHMASAVSVSPERMDEAGRPDAAEILREILRRAHGPREDDGAAITGLTPEEREVMRKFLDLWREHQDTGRREAR